MKQYAAIFDMDGTLVDNNPYHFKAWKELFERHNRVEVTPELYNEKISGVPGMVIMRNFFNGDYTEEQLSELFAHKTRNYKEIYAPYVAPINGLEHFLTELKEAGYKLAVASSATEANIEFILSRLPVKHLFDVVVDASRVSRSKPNPDIFLKAASGLGVSPGNCVVFEDSLSGVKAANAAGMKVVGITTSHTSHELQPVNRVINHYTGLTEREVTALFE